MNIKEWRPDPNGTTHGFRRLSDGARIVPSNIVFNVRTKKRRVNGWRAIAADGSFLGRFRTRKDALAVFDN